MELKWDETGKKLYETGVSHGVLYKKKDDGTYGAGEAWDGLTKVSESPDGGDTTAKYANNNIYLNLSAPEKFKGNIGAYTYPPSFAECDGSKFVSNGGNMITGLRVTGQTRRPFGLAYRTLLGNDAQGTDYGYQIHLVYNATAGVSSRDNQTVNESPDAIEFSWDFSTLPIPVPGMKPSAHLIIDSTKTPADKLAALEKVLYGTSSADARLPLPAEVITILGATAG